MERALLIAWAAGFIDGEGAVTIAGTRRQTTVVVRASNSSRAPIDRLQDLFGGSIAEIKPRRSTHRTLWEWKACSKKAIDALKEMQPFLSAKAEHARIALEFWSVCSRPVGWNACCKGKALSLPQEERERRAVYAAQIASLQVKTGNRRHPLGGTVIS